VDGHVLTGRVGGGPEAEGGSLLARFRKRADDLVPACGLVAPTPTAARMPGKGCGICSTSSGKTFCSSVVINSDPRPRSRLVVSAPTVPQSPGIVQVLGDKAEGGPADTDLVVADAPAPTGG
jgi:hypothetical protein